MRRQMILCLLGVLGTSSAFSAVTPFQHHDREGVAGCGVIAGQVLDETGSPVAGATVSSMITDRPPRARLKSSLTDEQGRFILTCAQPGSNRVYVSKEDQYYPNTFLSPFVDAKLIPLVDVLEQGVTEGVEVHLPPRGAKVVAHVIDTVTQQPVDGARMTFCKSDDPSKCLTINATSPNAEFATLVPSIRLAVKVSAPGYQNWYYKEGNASSRINILLTPGSIKGLTVHLRPRGKNLTKAK